MKKELVYYAQIRWTPNDVKSLRPRWSLARCEQFLAANEHQIQERTVEHGWAVIDALLPHKPLRKN